MPAGVIKKRDLTRAKIKIIRRKYCLALSNEAVKILSAMVTSLRLISVIASCLESEGRPRYEWSVAFSLLDKNPKEILFLFTAHDPSAALGCRSKGSSLGFPRVAGLGSRSPHLCGIAGSGSRSFAEIEAHRSLFFCCLP